jgi:hypothetical protein
LAATGPDSLADGMTNFAPQAGHIPRLPAKFSLTFSLCPLGQEKRIPILLLASLAFHYRDEAKGGKTGAPSSPHASELIMRKVATIRPAKRSHQAAAGSKN